MSTGINPVRRSVCIYQGLQCICLTLVSVPSLLLCSLIWGQDNHQIREWIFKSHLVQLSPVQAQSSTQPPDLEHLELVPLSLWTQLICCSVTNCSVTAWALLRPPHLSLASPLQLLLSPGNSWGIYFTLFWKLKCQNFQPRLLWDVGTATAVAVWFNSASHHLSEMGKKFTKRQK